MNNTLGTVINVTNFGESHGPAVGCVIQGVPAGVKINIVLMQQWLALRKTNATSYGSTRNEADDFKIISGVYNGVTIGAPITIIIENTDAKSTDYTALENVYRPNHADYTNHIKYGIRDHRGGGRTSIRVTAPMVAAGALLYSFLQEQTGINICSYVQQIGTTAMPSTAIHFYEEKNIFSNPYNCPHAATAQAIEAQITTAKNNGDTLGGIIHTIIQNVPVGIGEPIYSKLQAQLAHAMLSINTVKGFEYGDGFAAAAQSGSIHNDVFTSNNNTITTTTNHSGGIQGGISNGMAINFNTAFKPISSIAKEQQTITTKQDNIAITISGRHDVCAVPRAIPIVNAYTAIVLADLWLQNKWSKI